MSSKETSFVGLITFDASIGHSELTTQLEKWGFEKKSTHGHKLPANTYVGVVKRTVETNTQGNFNATDLKNTSDSLCDYYRNEMLALFDNGDIDGKIYVLFSWALVADDSVTR
ncbi:hypothetical protein PB70LOC_04466 [Pectobacterium versatile]|uniref:hypothetical protein n=1 Tax=Pectobacterium TaxID=122277 RepID=UPI000CDF2BCC|nr:hypothetical protein [Pectobacterium versatile]POY54810.1 hypothetical protein PB70LOC_04466 [Pectobacterium versatile]POY60843.1 hypothetical protein PB69LOC_04466 [Pectobacterium versatile]